MVAIKRLTASDAEKIAQCVRGVYGQNYAHELFYDLPRLTVALETGDIMSVGALNDAGEVIAHMVMTHRGADSTPELGSTVVTSSARGGGIAWKVGAELISWCKELGFSGFLHYPTTEHHIMQRQSVNQGFVTGVMLGYIPVGTTI